MLDFLKVDLNSRISRANLVVCLILELHSNLNSTVNRKGPLLRERELETVVGRIVLLFVFA